MGVARAGWETLAAELCGGGTMETEGVGLHCSENFDFVVVLGRRGNGATQSPEFSIPTFRSQARSFRV